MKQINLTKMMKDNELDYIDRKEILGMRFIKRNDGNYIVEGGNGLIVSEKERLQMINDGLVKEDIGCNCAKEITKEISKNKKKIEEIENIEKAKSIKE